MDADLALALQLQEEWNAGHKQPRKKMDIGNELYPTMSPIDPSLDYIDPTPDIYKMFVNFDKRFFWNSLGSVQVMWSSRMTSCAGLCRYRSRNGEISVHLSLPLLKFRPRKDLVETLLHEMIHAYLFVTKNYRDRDSHGPNFICHMDRINKCAGTNITVYHTFHAEVDANRTHWWRCNGPCQHQKPFYGLVKRSMNRAPGPNDFWFGDHQTKCGGTFIKIKEPENYKSKNSKTLNKTKEVSNPIKKGNRVEDYFMKVNSKSKVLDLGTRTITKKGLSATKVATISDLIEGQNSCGECSSSSQSSPIKKEVVPFSGKGYTTGKNTALINEKPWLKHLDTLSTLTAIKSPKPNISPSVKPWLKQLNSSRKESLSEKTPNMQVADSKKMKISNECEKPLHENVIICLVSCPICNTSVSESGINDHLDLCLYKNSLEDEEKNSKCIACNQSLKRRSTALPLCNICGQNVSSSDIDVIESESDDKLINCPMCDKKMANGDLERHLEICILNGVGPISLFSTEEDEDIVTLD